MPRAIFGYHFNEATMDELVAQVIRLPEAGQGVRLVVTANLDHIVQLQQNDRLRDAYDKAWVRTIDGTPVWIYARIRGAGVSERVTGADLVPRLAESLPTEHSRLFFVAASESIARLLLLWADERGFPPGSVKAEVPPFGFERDAAFTAQLSEAIREHGTTHLLFGVGCPKSEVWINENRHKLGDLYAFCVGAALAFFVGEQARAPIFMRKVGLEWVWRVGQEPNRLAQRYLIQSWGFATALLKDVRGKYS